MHGFPLTPPAQPVPSSTAGAILLVDAQGRVESGNAAAAKLWAISAEQLPGRNFATLFTQPDPGNPLRRIPATWESIHNAEVEGPLLLQICGQHGPPISIQALLTALSGPPVRWIVSLNPTGSPQADSSSAHALPHDLLQTLSGRGPLGFFDLNFTRSEAYFSPSWKSILGHDEASLPNSLGALRGLIHPDDSAAAPDHPIGRSPRTGAIPFVVEYRMRHASGRYVWIQCAGVQCYAPNGAFHRVVGTHLDITERKEGEEAALRAEERLRSLGASGNLALFEIDFIADSAWFSPAFRTVLGYGTVGLPDLPESFLRLLPPEDSTGGLLAFFATEPTAHPARFVTLRLRHREGSDVWLHAGIFPTWTRKRELLRVLGFVAPMPNTPGSAGLGPLTAEQFSAIMAQLHEGVMLTDEGGLLLYANSAAERLLGRPAAQLIGQPAVENFRLVYRTSGESVDHPLTRTLAGEADTEFAADFTLLSGADATPRPLLLSCHALRDAHGRITGAVAIFRDPKEMRLTPDELVRANRFDALGQLAGGIAHDFNNLLTTILGGISLAKENRDPSTLETSERACLAAKALSKQLLASAKGHLGTRQTVNVAELLTEATRLSGAGSTTRIEVSAPADLAPIHVDRTQILQVLQNLIFNALQALPSGRGSVWVSAGHVHLTTGQVPPLAPGRYVAIEVRDDGPGIAPEHIEHIFDPFFTTKKTGTGLGLSTALSLVRHHGGQIGLQSELGVGTAFSVFLPCAQQEPELEARRAPTLRFGTGRILIMDDDPEIGTLTAGMVESLGYKHDLAKNGDEAIAFYKRYLNIGRPYDVVLLDLTVIGGMGGEPCFKALRELDADVRAVVSSGYDDETMARQYLDLGFCGYLTKPYRVADLGRMIKKVLGT